jgi:hypothetical protein
LNHIGIPYTKNPAEKMLSQGGTNPGRYLRRITALYAETGISLALLPLDCTRACERFFALWLPKCHLTKDFLQDIIAYENSISQN